MSNLLYSDVAEELRGSVRELLADRCSPETVLARCESGAPDDGELWSTLASDIGVAGLLVPEERGGAGASVLEAAVVAEETGRAVAPVPYLTSAVLATTALLACEGDPAAELLARMARGDTTTVAAAGFATAPDAGFPDSVTARADRLSGTVTAVADGGAADSFLVPALGEDGPRWYLVPASDAAVTAETALDLTRGLATVTFSETPGTRVAEGNRAYDAFRALLATGAGVLASEQVGIAQWCLDTTVEYVKQRHQFGRPVGSFQALKHRLSEVYLRLVTARAAARHAASALAEGGPEADVAVSLAAAHCGDVAVHAAEECLQLHGGIGMTWEHPVHLYLKRAKSDQLALGTPGAHRARLGALVDLPPA